MNKYTKNICSWTNTDWFLVMNSISISPHLLILFLLICKGRSLVADIFCFYVIVGYTGDIAEFFVQILFEDSWQMSWRFFWSSLLWNFMANFSLGHFVVKFRKKSLTAIFCHLVVKLHKNVVSILMLVSTEIWADFRMVPII